MRRRGGPQPRLQAVATGRVNRVSSRQRSEPGAGHTLSSFYEQPILNSPYRSPELHNPLDDRGQPIEGPPREGRRPPRFIVPVPPIRSRASADQASLDLE